MKIPPERSQLSRASEIGDRMGSSPLTATALRQTSSTASLKKLGLHKWKLQRPPSEMLHFVAFCPGILMETFAFKVTAEIGDTLPSIFGRQYYPKLPVDS
jgi:hypothetical protein